jgi:D-alanyl-D-alanine carboxypeptidase
MKNLSYFKFIYFLLRISFLLLYISNNANAQNIHNRSSSLIIDRLTGKILHQENASKQLHPASLTKLMTIYLTFENLKSGKININQQLTISNYAASRPKMNMNLFSGEKMTVRDAMLATIIRSANDTSTALGELISGSEQEFANLMTKRARMIGMHHTIFKNASGLHHPAQKTTASDMAKLAVALKKDFPEYYHYFSKTEFSYKGNIYNGHNYVTKNYPGATGLKTGFINASGFNLITSAKRGNTDLIGVVFGGDTAKLRDKKMISLLDKYFDNKELQKPTRIASVNKVKPIKIQKPNKYNKKNEYKMVSNKTRLNKKRTSQI